MFDRILNVTLPNNLLEFEEDLRRIYPPLGLHKGTLDSPCFLILLIYTKHTYNKMKSRTDPVSSFPWVTQALLGMFSNIPRDIPQNVWVHSPECLSTFPQNVWVHSPESLGTFPRMFDDILQNFWGHCPKYLITFPRMFENITRNVTCSLFPAFLTFRSSFLYSWFYT